MFRIELGGKVSEKEAKGIWKVCSVCGHILNIGDIKRTNLDYRAITGTRLPGSQ